MTKQFITLVKIVNKHISNSSQGTIEWERWSTGNCARN